MGKSKKRILLKGQNAPFENITREDALLQVIKALKNRSLNDNIRHIIMLFGLSCEELLENGAKYEDVISLGLLLK